MCRNCVAADDSVAGGRKCGKNTDTCDWFGVCTSRGRTLMPMFVVRNLIGIATTIAIVYFLMWSQKRDPEGFIGAYKVGLTVALVMVLWVLIPHARAFAKLVTDNARDSRRITARLHKLSAASLQAAYLQARIVTPRAGLRVSVRRRPFNEQLQL